MKLTKQIEADLQLARAEVQLLERIQRYIKQSTPKKAKRKKKGLHPNAAKGLKAYHDQQRKLREKKNAA